MTLNLIYLLIFAFYLNVSNEVANRKRAENLFKKFLHKITMGEFGIIEYSGIHKFLYEDTTYKYSIRITYQKKYSGDSCEYIIDDLAGTYKRLYLKSKNYEISPIQKTVYIYDRPWSMVHDKPVDDFYFRLAINQKDKRFFIDSSAQVFIKDTFFSRKHFIEVQTSNSNFTPPKKRG